MRRKAGKGEREVERGRRKARGAVGVMESQRFTEGTASWPEHSWGQAGRECLDVTRFSDTEVIFDLFKSIFSGAMGQKPTFQLTESRLGESQLHRPGRGVRLHEDANALEKPPVKVGSGRKWDNLTRPHPTYLPVSQEGN